MITLTREEAQQVPLIEQLESVPEDARMIYEHSPFESENIPIGALCRQAAKALRAKLSEPEPDLRKLLKIRQAAWKDVRSEYKDDPECCFALGFDVGYDAVAQRVEPPVKESGEGFESSPASPIAWMSFNAYGEEDDIWYVEPKGDLPEGWTYKPLYDTPPQCEWVGLTDEETNALIRKWAGELVFEVNQVLKEKNNG